MTVAQPGALAPPPCADARAQRCRVLTLSCRDRPGIVGAVGSLLADADCNILESSQFGDAESGRFFMRVMFESAESPPDDDGLNAAFASLAGEFAMALRIVPAQHRPRVVVLVSRHDHCLNDLLYRYRTGTLPMTLCAVASNHRDAEALVRSHGVAFHWLPVSVGNRAEQEAALWDLVCRTQAELVVLARYMQILSDELCARLCGRAINIHHSFLPGFKGARPYHQAHARGVKLIGATAHYVTPELDEGPIIEQHVTRVSHWMSPQQLAAVGRDIECQTLASAVRLHLEGRVFLNGTRTVVL